MIPKKKEMITLVILSLKYDNAFNLGYLKYKDWSLKIAAIIGIFKQNIIRIIFNDLVKNNIFQKNNDTPINYLFNPYNKVWKHPPYDGIVRFDD